MKATIPVLPASHPLLYTYRRCPYAMRARLALLVANVAFDAHEIILRDKPAAMLNRSPKGTVPVLVLSSGQLFEQSWDIVKWALTQDRTTAEVQHWWHQAQTPDNLELLHRNDGDFKRHLDRYKYPQRFATSGNTEATDEPAGYRDQAVKVLLEPLEQRLAKERFLGGTQPCATDLGIFPFVRQFSAVDPAWFDSLPLAHVKNWLAYWLGSPLFEACMQKLPSNVITPFPVPVATTLW